MRVTQSCFLRWSARFLATTAALSLLMLAGCAESSDDVSEGADEAQTSQALQGTSGDYSQLTPAERAAAEELPWDKFPSRYDRPPQQAIDSLTHTPVSPAPPNHAAEQRLDAYRTAWAAKKADLQADGHTPEEIEQERHRFKYESLTERRGQ